MAESTDKQTRQIAERRIEAGKEFESYQEAQNQLLAIHAEQRQNLALHASETANLQAQNQTLSQAAEIMSMDDLNPTTQGMLAGYGLSQPRVVKNSNVQRQGPNNITINNTTINNTTGPVQGRDINIRPQENNQGKFKAWISNVFARQEGEWQKRNQEYNRRESSLTRNSNKMMRKLEELGKGIGRAVDPRRIANNVSNPLMNVLKTIGLIAFAKRLPIILDFLDNAETKIKGWFGNIGETISAKLGDMITGSDGDREGGLIERISNALYNKEETGALNKLLKAIDENIINRKRVADSSVSFSDVGVLNVKELISRFGQWLSVFLGGTSVAKSTLNFRENVSQKEAVEKRSVDEGKYKSNIYGFSRGIDAQVGWAGEVNLRINETLDSDDFLTTQRSSIIMTKAGMNDDEIKKGYQTHAETDKSKQSVVNYLNKIGGAHIGEATVLTKKAHELVEPGGRGWYFDTSYLSFTDPNRLRNNNYFAPLSLSLQFISDVRRGDVDVPRLLWYVTVLKNSIKFGGAVPVFDDFLKYLSGDKSFNINTWPKENNINERAFVLVEEPMIDEDRRHMLIHNPNLGSTKMLSQVKHKVLPNYLDNYLKIFPKDSLSGNQTPIPLTVPDFRKIKNATEWKFCMLNLNGLNNLLTNAIGTEDINYKDSTQDSLINTLSKTIDLSDKSIKKATYNKDYEQSWDAITQIEKDAEQSRLTAALEKERESVYTQDHSTKYIKSGKSTIDTKKARVCYSEFSSDFNKVATESDKEKAQRIFYGSYIPGVTQAFGGSGTLTGNFMEWRDNRYHYGVDLSNGAGKEVYFPGYGTVVATGVNSDGHGSYIDIVDGDGYTTRYWHTRLHGSLQKGSKVIPGQPIGITEKKGENGLIHNPHIHVEVHDPKWTKSNEHEHYVNPLIYWSKNKAPLPDNVASDNTMQTEPPAIEQRDSGASGGPGRFSPGEVTSPVITKRSMPLVSTASGITDTKNGNLNEESTQLLKYLVEQVSLITQSTSYTASALSPLIDNINTGFVNVVNSNQQKNNNRGTKIPMTPLNVENGGNV